jgi:hypothetical protein
MPKSTKQDSLSTTSPPSIQLQKYKITNVNQHNIDRFITIIVIIIAYYVHRSCQSALSKVRSSASDFKIVHLLISLRSSSRCLRRPLAPSIFPAITCFSRQFLNKTCPVQLPFLRFNEGTEITNWMHAIVSS